MDRDSSSLRVLHLYPKGDFFTGAAIQVWELVRGLQARGHDIVLATRPDSHWASLAAGASLTYYGLPMTSELDLRSVLGLIRVLRRHRIQIVHAHKGRARTLILLAGLFTGTPVLVLNRGVSFPLDRFNRLGYTTRRVTAIIAVCEAIKANLVQAGVPEAKIHVIYSGTDTERFHPGVDRTRIRDELGLTTEQFLVTQIGVRGEKGTTTSWRPWRRSPPWRRPRTCSWWERVTLRACMRRRSGLGSNETSTSSAIGRISRRFSPGATAASMRPIAVSD